MGDLASGHAQDQSNDKDVFLESGPVGPVRVQQANQSSTTTDDAGDDGRPTPGEKERRDAIVDQQAPKSRQHDGYGDDLESRRVASAYQILDLRQPTREHADHR